MQQAFRLDSKIVINAATFDKQIGHGILKPGDYGIHDAGRCMYCLQPVLIRGGGQRKRHFHHRRTDNQVFCPLKDSAKEASISIEAQEYINVELQQTLRNSWQAIFLELNKYVESFALDEFWALLEVARKSQLFHRKQVRAWMIPYMMMALKDFSVETSFQKKRSATLRFFFIGRGSTVTKRTIWVEKGDLPRLFRWKPDQVEADPIEIKVGSDWLIDNHKIPWIKPGQLDFTQMKVNAIR